VTIAQTTTAADTTPTAANTLRVVLSRVGDVGLALDARVGGAGMWYSCTAPPGDGFPADRTGLHEVPSPRSS
jgi:hypothetical protein